MPLTIDDWVAKQEKPRESVPTGVLESRAQPMTIDDWVSDQEERGISRPRKPEPTTPVAPPERAEPTREEPFRDIMAEGARPRPEEPVIPSVPPVIAPADGRPPAIDIVEHLQKWARVGDYTPPTREEAVIREPLTLKEQLQSLLHKKKAHVAAWGEGLLSEGGAKILTSWLDFWPSAYRGTKELVGLKDFDIPIADDVAGFIGGIARGQEERFQKYLAELKEEGYLGAHATSRVINAIGETLIFLNEIKRIRLPYGGGAMQNTTRVAKTLGRLKHAQKIALFRAMTQENVTMRDRLNTWLVSSLYMSTPALSGHLKGKAARFGLDFVLNSAVSANIKEGYADIIKSDLDPFEKLMRSVELLGPDMVFAMMTGYIGDRDARETAEFRAKTQEAVERVDLPKEAAEFRPEPTPAREPKIDIPPEREPTAEELAAERLPPITEIKPPPTDIPAPAPEGEALARAPELLVGAEARPVEPAPPKPTDITRVEEKPTQLLVERIEAKQDLPEDPREVAPTSQSGFMRMNAFAKGTRDFFNWAFRQHGGVDDRVVPAVERFQVRQRALDLDARMKADQIRLVKDHLKRSMLTTEEQKAYNEDVTKVMEQLMSEDDFRAKYSNVFDSDDPRLQAAGKTTLSFLRNITDYREQFAEEIVPIMKRIGMSDDAVTIEANKMMYVPYEYMRWLNPFFKPAAEDVARATDLVKGEYVDNIIALRERINAYDDYDAVLRFLQTGDVKPLSPKSVSEEAALQTLRNDYRGLAPFLKDLRVDTARGQLDFDAQLASIQSSAREYIDTLLGKSKSSRTGNPFDMYHLMQRRLPEVFQLLYGKVQDPERVVHSMVNIQQNLLNTVRFLDQIMGMNADPDGRPTYSTTPMPEHGLTHQLKGERYAALDGMYVTRELERIVRDDIIRVGKQRDTMMEKITAEVIDFYSLAVKSARTAAIFTPRLVLRNILTNIAYPMMNGDWLREGHAKHQADGWRLAKDVYQFEAGRIQPGTERYERVTSALKELGDNGIWYLGQAGLTADIDVFARQHGFASADSVPSAARQWYERQLTEARIYYSMADLPYKYAMWQTAKEMFPGDLKAAQERVHRYGQYPEHLGRGLRATSKLPLADFPLFMHDATRIWAHGTTDFARNAAMLGRGGDWHQVLGYMLGTAVASGTLMATAPLIKRVLSFGLNAIRKLTQEDTPDIEFSELESEEEAAILNLVPRYDRNNPSYMWKESDTEGNVRIYRIPMRGFSSPFPPIEIGAGVIGRNMKEAGGWSKMLSDPKMLYKIPVEIVGEYMRNLLQTGMVPQAGIRTLIGREAGLVPTSTYQTPEGGIIGAWNQHDPKRFEKIGGILAEQGLEMFPPLFLSQQQQRGFKRIWKQAQESPEGIGDPMTHQQMSEIAVNSILPLRIYSVDANSARSTVLQNISPIISEVQDAKMQDEVDHALIQHHYTMLIEKVGIAKRAFVDTGLVNPGAFRGMIVDTGLSTREAMNILRGDIPPEYRRRPTLTAKDKFERRQERGAPQPVSISDFNSRIDRMKQLTDVKGKRYSESDIYSILEQSEETGKKAHFDDMRPSERKVAVKIMDDIISERQKARERPEDVVKSVFQSESISDKEREKRRLIQETHKGDLRAIDDAMERGEITQDEYKQISIAAKRHPLVSDIELMSVRDAIRVYNATRGELREIIKPHVRRKIAIAENLSSNRKHELLKILD